MDIMRRAAHWFWPEICAHCREDLAWDAVRPLCRSCSKKLEPAGPPFCLRCADAVRPSKTHCRACSSRLFACEIIRSAFFYRGAAVSVVHAFKYRGRRNAAAAAGFWMAEAFQKFPELGAPDVLVPIPLHARRRRERGYNQARVIAASLSAKIGIPVEELLVRQRATRPQWSLGRSARRENLSGAFAVQAAAAGRRILLIDDVCTSSASLEAAAQALLAAKAERVCGYVFARQAQPVSS